MRTRAPAKEESPQSNPNGGRPSRNAIQEKAIIDSRPEALRLQGMVSEVLASPRAAQLKDAQAMMDASAHPNGAGRNAQKNPVQLKNAVQAGLLPAGYVLSNGATDLYNNVRVPQGNLYRKDIAAAADGFAAVAAIQTAESALVGAPFAGAVWLDGIANLPAVPSSGKWNGAKDAYINNLRTRLNCLDAVYDPVFAWEATGPGRLAAEAFVAALAIPRNAGARDLDTVGAVDPFMTRTVITTPNNQVWRYDTNYSNSAYAYITEIADPTLGRSAKIIPEDQYAAQHGNALANGNADDPYTYSSGHVRNDRTIGEQLAHRGTPDTKGEFHERLDAQTKLIAEGARFIPVRTAGTALRADSRFYGTAPAAADDLNYKYVNYTILVNRWGQWFNRAFNITAATMLAEVDLRGDTTKLAERIPRPGVDYDLQNDAMF